jgi:hypothetical protein
MVGRKIAMHYGKAAMIVDPMGGNIDRAGINDSATARNANLMGGSNRKAGTSKRIAAGIDRKAATNDRKAAIGKMKMATAHRQAEIEHRKAIYIASVRKGEKMQMRIQRNTVLMF